MSVPSLYPYRYISSGAGILYFSSMGMRLPLLGNTCIVRTFFYIWLRRIHLKIKRGMTTKQWIGIEEAATKYQVSTRRIITWCKRQEIIYSEVARTGKPVFCIVDDTIASKTKPSSRALHPIEDAYFHQSHLKGKQDYGHQAVAVMLSCNGIVLNYAFVMYNKSISKIDIVENIAKELPVPPVMSYFLCDCWYTSEKIINTFAGRGFHTIGALKTNRMLYPFGFKKKLNEFAALLSTTRSHFHLVTVKKQKYYVYRYEGNLNGIENAVVLLSYPEKAFGNPRALRAFLSTDVSLSVNETLSYYVYRWSYRDIFSSV